MKALFVIFILWTATVFADDSFRNLTSGDLQELAKMVAQSMRDCGQTAVQIGDISNRTSEHIDKELLGKDLQTALVALPVTVTPGAAAKLNLRVASQTAENRSSYRNTYTVVASLVVEGQPPVERSVQLVKSSEIKTGEKKGD